MLARSLTRTSAKASRVASSTQMCTSSQPVRSGPPLRRLTSVSRFPVTLCPAPFELIRPSFLTSIWISSPGREHW